MFFLILRKTTTTKIETNIPARTTPNAKTGFFNVSKIFHHIKIQFLAAFKNYILPPEADKAFLERQSRFDYLHRTLQISRDYIIIFQMLISP